MQAIVKLMIHWPIDKNLMKIEESWEERLIQSGINGKQGVLMPSKAGEAKRRATYDEIEHASRLKANQLQPLNFHHWFNTP